MPNCIWTIYLLRPFVVVKALSCAHSDWQTLVLRVIHCWEDISKMPWPQANVKTYLTLLNLLYCGHGKTSIRFREPSLQGVLGPQITMHGRKYKRKKVSRIDARSLPNQGSLWIWDRENKCGLKIKTASSFGDEICQVWLLMYYIV